MPINNYTNWDSIFLPNPARDDRDERIVLDEFWEEAELLIRRENKYKRRHKKSPPD